MRGSASKLFLSMLSRLSSFSKFTSTESAQGTTPRSTHANGLFAGAVVALLRARSSPSLVVSSSSPLSQEVDEVLRMYGKVGMGPRLRTRRSWRKAGS